MIGNYKTLDHLQLALSSAASRLSSAISEGNIAETHHWLNTVGNLIGLIKKIDAQIESK